MLFPLESCHKQHFVGSLLYFSLEMDAGFCHVSKVYWRIRRHLQTLMFYTQKLKRKIKGASPCINNKEGSPLLSLYILIVKEYNAWSKANRINGSLSIYRIWLWSMPMIWIKTQTQISNPPCKQFFPGQTGKYIRKLPQSLSTREPSHCALWDMSFHII